VVVGRVAGIDRKGGRLPVGTSDEKGSDAVASSTFTTKGE
jgi:hypothetical protein